MQEKEEKITFFNERDKSLNDALTRLMLRGKAAIAASKACEYIYVSKSGRAKVG